ncbi:MAG: hypothetical protein J6S60_02890 [Oscillospiraceae bacterium]|nr:hypothetical protein [Oscillospiraceae bacterium]
MAGWLTPARVFLLLTLGTFIWSCARYRLGDRIGGDRLLFLAWCFLVCGYIDEFRMLYGLV